MFIYQEHYNLCFRQLIRQPYDYPTSLMLKKKLTI